MTQTTQTIELEVSTLTVIKELDIKAPPQAVFDAILAEMGPGSEMPDGSPFPMVLEPWPGGRWYRDLGDNAGHQAGHWWGTVQVIKPPTLLEIHGPLFMSYPALSHVQYRVTPVNATTSHLRMVHKAMGQIDPDHRAGVNSGWDHGLGRIRQIAEKTP